MRIKDSSVKVGKFVPPLVFALNCIDGLYTRYKVEAVITSGCELTTKHMDGSRHYTGEAADLRSSGFAGPDAFRFSLDVHENIGPEFDFIIEDDHFHLEYDPK